MRWMSIEQNGTNEMYQAILLDRDGVINRERKDYVKSWDEFEFLPNVKEALRRLAAFNIPIGVITNQSAIGRGYVTKETVDNIHQKLTEIVEAQGGRLDAFFVCPHHPDENCVCRKPKPGLLYQAAQHFGVKIEECLFVGDALTDYQAAIAAHSQSMLVQSGRQAADLPTLLQGNEFQGKDVLILPDLYGAVDEILRRYGKHEESSNRT